MKIVYDQSCSFTSVPTSTRVHIQQWLNKNRIHSFGNAKQVDFDEAYILFHKSSKKDPHNKTPHLTVRLSNAEMRANLEFATLHWRPNGLSTWQEDIEVDQKEKETHSDDGDPHAPKRQKTDSTKRAIQSETEVHKEGSKQSFNQ